MPLSSPSVVLPAVKHFPINRCLRGTTRRELEVQLDGNDEVLFNASIVLGIGNTIVLGTLQLPDDQALILALRAELAG